jgi:hypothetical protein
MKRRPPCKRGAQGFRIDKPFAGLLSEEGHRRRHLDLGRVLMLLFKNYGQSLQAKVSGALGTIGPHSMRPVARS